MCEKAENLNIINSNKIEDLVKVIKGKAKKIIVLSGAGISTAAGIPDFRSQV